MQIAKSTIEALHNNPDVQAVLQAMTAKVGDAAPEIILSLILIFLVLLLLAAIYRGASGDERIEIPVALTLYPRCKEKEIIFAPGHLKEPQSHAGKAPRVDFYLKLPDGPAEGRKILTRPLKISVNARNSANIFDQSYDSRNPENGGQIGIAQDTRDEIERRLSEINHKEGRRLDADTSRFVIKIRYPTILNINYLLREHPDTGVRVGAWIFILTSVFSTAQSVLFK